MFLPTKLFSNIYRVFTSNLYGLRLIIGYGCFITSQTVNTQILQLSVIIIFHSFPYFLVSKGQKKME